MTNAPDHLTRRRFLGTSAAAGATAALAAADSAEAKKKKAAKKPAKKKAKTKTADYVVVGAGFSGLVAARNLVKAGKSVVVLEARDRVGGRVWNHELANGEVSERGGTFVGPTQDHLMALAKELGIGTFDVFDDGQDVYISPQGQRETYSDTGATGTAPADPAILPDLTTIVTQLDQMSTTVPVDAPWDSANAGTYDAQTLDSWIRANQTNPDFIKLAAAATRPIFGAEPREISLLYTLFYIASSGNETNPGTFERNFDTRQGAQQSRFVGGSQLIALDMAKQLGRRVVLSSPVRRIDQTATGVVVRSDKMTVKAKRVVVAMPPTLTGRIIFNPPLPNERAQLVQRAPQGALIKAAAVYDKPFWRADGLTGTALDVGGPVSATFDDSPPSGDVGVIFGFIGGDQARSYQRMSAADRQKAVVGQYTNFFGDQASKPTDFFESNWIGEEWSRGCPVAIYGPGTLLAYGPAIRAPFSRVHWAGTETSNYWNGYMDGAVRSGERVATEVLDAG